jgi:hypothetical protein
MNRVDIDYQQRLATEATNIRDSGDLGRSEPLVRLFDFLLERSLSGAAPKEIEVACEVFGKTTDFDVMLDASVRVYIHRLRRKLAERYARLPDHPDQISIPLGEYRMVLASSQLGVDEPEPPAVSPIPSSSRKHYFWFTVISFALINASAIAYFFGRSGPDAAPIANNLWKPLIESKRPTIVVMGDYYIFGEANEGAAVSRLVRDFSINSREELDAYLMLNPRKVGSYVDVDLHYLPVSSGRALRSLLPVINAATEPSGIRPPVETMSDLQAEVVKNVNIVYVGFLSGLGPLQAPLFRASGFKLGSTFDELIDKASGRHFSSDWGVLTEGKSPQRDFGYIASLPGPVGNRILIVAGTRDPAVAQMAEIAVDKKQLDAIDAKSGGGAFEALFEVRTLDNLNLGSSLILARPMRADSIWQPAKPTEDDLLDTP